MAGLIDNLKRAAEATEQLADGTKRVRDNLEAISEIEPDLPADGGIGATIAGASVAPIGGGGGAAAAGGSGARIGGGGGSSGGGSGRIGMGGGGAGGGGGVITSPEGNAFIRSQILPQDAVARAVATTITDGFNMLAKILKGDGGSKFRIGGGL
jgi:hypothetical protein